ncbi:dioxygenase family protein [Variovorax soli]|uniref:dioxygenase family protein n=1 Tax=Variovorax soli TaxID=376815 RepID=UPI0009FD81E0
MSFIAHSREPSMPRRRASAAVLVAFPALCLGLARAQPGAGARRATPSQTEGPFYPVQLPADTDHDLLRNGTLQHRGGDPAWVEGTVADLQGRPLAGATVEIWQCDQSGHYHHPGDGGRADPAFQGFGRVQADAEGRWRFHTLRPVPYSGRTPHIHFKVRQGARELLTTQLYVEGAAGNERDFLWRNLGRDDRAALTRPFERGADGWRASFPIFVAAA